MESELQKSYASAADVAAQYPQYSTQIIDGAKEAFLAGDQWAYTAGIIAVLLGGALVYVMFPKLADEKRLLQEYHHTDVAAAAQV